jgi:uncharacterized protein
MEKLGTIVRFDREAGVLEVRRGGKIGSPWPVAGSIIPAWPLDTSPLEEAVERVAKFLATDANGSSVRYQAIVDIIERAAPRIQSWPGGNLVQSGETLIEAATKRALALDQSALFIQGPPGTGKTFSSAYVILSLIAVGKRIGVSSHSHKAINNLGQDRGGSWRNWDEFLRGEKSEHRPRQLS